MLRTDPARPRVTYYDDTPGPTQGERIELSAKVLANWVSKAANLLQDELSAEPGTVVALDLPVAHWRTLYWSVAAWSVGCVVVIGPADDAEVLVTTAPQDTDAQQVVVTLAALARSHAGELPAGVLDEAHDLSTYGDQFTAYDEPHFGDPALRTEAGDTSYADLVQTGGDYERRVYLSGDDAQVLRDVLAAWADDGSVVLVRNPDDARMPHRLASEGVTGATV